MTGALHEFATPGGRDDLALTAIGRVRPSLDQPGLLQVIDEVGHHCAVEAEVVRERKLARLRPPEDLGHHRVAPRTVGKVADRFCHSIAVGTQQHTERPAEVVAEIELC